MFALRHCFIDDSGKLALPTSMQLLNKCDTQQISRRAGGFVFSGSSSGKAV